MLRPGDGVGAVAAVRQSSHRVRGWTAGHARPGSLVRGSRGHHTASAGCSRVPSLWELDSKSRDAFPRMVNCMDWVSPKKWQHYKRKQAAQGYLCFFKVLPEGGGAKEHPPTARNLFSRISVASVPAGAPHQHGGGWSV